MINFTAIINSLSTLGKFWREKVNSQLVRWNLIFVISQLAVIIVKFTDLPQLVPLFYSLPWGTSRLATASTLFIIPLISILVSVTNSLLAVFFLKSTKFFSYLLLIFSLLFSLLGLVALIQIIHLVA